MNLNIRIAAAEDLTTIVSLLANDPLGALREDKSESLSENYKMAFQAISSDPNHDLLVADFQGAVVGVLQLSFIPHLTYEGGWRAQIEGVRVAEEFRSKGIGRALFESAISRARDRGCHLVQLTTDKRRPEALNFYLGLGFEPTHDGLKLHFGKSTT